MRAGGWIGEARGWDSGDGAVLRGAVEMMLTSNPGPMARLREVLADPQTMSVLMQRLTTNVTAITAAKGDFIASMSCKIDATRTVLRFSALPCILHESVSMRPVKGTRVSRSTTKR